MSALLPPKRELRKPKGALSPPKLAIPSRDVSGCSSRSEASLAAPPSTSPNPFNSASSSGHSPADVALSSDDDYRQPALTITSVSTPVANNLTITRPQPPSRYPSTVTSLDPDHEDGGKLAGDRIIVDIQKAISSVSIGDDGFGAAGGGSGSRPGLDGRASSSTPKVRRPGNGDSSLSLARLGSVEGLSTSADGHLPSLGSEQTRQSATDDDDVEIKSEDLEELESLGEGASGAVVKVRHRPTGLLLAKKTVGTSPNPSVHRQTLRELAFNREIAGGNCDCIVKYYGAFLEDQNTQIAILMEYAEGGSLDAINRRITAHGGRVGEKILGKVAQSVLEGLAFLHRHKIIHRDIKPSNILVTREGVIKLCDLGVSGELVLSMANTFMGTSMYMAPERITGKEYNIRSDVWSLGFSLLELAFARHPLAPVDGPPLQTFELVQAILTFQMPSFPAEEEASGCKWSKGFQHFITICLERNPGERHPPETLLGHPWIVRAKAKEADLAKWVAAVWGWQE